MSTISVSLCLAVSFTVGASPKTNGNGFFDVPAAKVATWLPEKPEGVGRPIADRKAWSVIAEHPKFRKFVDNAAKNLGKPLPEVTDDDYLDFSRTGNRNRGQAAQGRRYGRLYELALAECLEDKGRFLPDLNKAILAVCQDKSWTLAAHDRDLGVFQGKKMSVDLLSSDISWNLATIDWWLGDKLSQDARTAIRRELKRRTFDPYWDAVLKNGKGAFWIKATHNWNAVCSAGVLGAALATVDSKKDRAAYVSTAVKSMGFFFDGFTADGYCSEGIGYWNYGFGHFVQLSETILQATGGNLDLFKHPKLSAIASFGRNCEILPGVFPSFADCGTPALDRDIMAYLSRRLGWGLQKTEEENLLAAGGQRVAPAEFAVFGFPNSASQSKPVSPKDAAPALRYFFRDAGILIARPATGTDGLGVALKGGHNAEHHNHNDVGSFVVALGKTTPILDPGGEVYTAKTFSSKRYESNVLNSFGHPVPRVASRLQETGANAAAKILKADFTDRSDTLVLDIRSCYAVPTLKTLTRTFIFSREKRGKLTVIDEAEFTKPESFGSALITFSPWKSLDANRIRIGEGADAVDVTFDAGQTPIAVKADEIKENLSRKGTAIRLGLDLKEPTAHAKLTITIEPAK